MKSYGSLKRLHIFFIVVIALGLINLYDLLSGRSLFNINNVLPDYVATFVSLAIIISTCTLFLLMHKKYLHFPCIYALSIIPLYILLIIWGWSLSRTIEPESLFQWDVIMILRMIVCGAYIAFIVAEFFLIDSKLMADRMKYIRVQLITTCIPLILVLIFAVYGFICMDLEITFESELLTGLNYFILSGFFLLYILNVNVLLTYNRNCSLMNSGLYRKLKNVNNFKYCIEKADKDGFIIVNGIVYGYIGDHGTVNIPAGVSEIAPFAFSSNNRVEEIRIPSSVTQIGEYAFFACSNLKRVDLSDNVRIGYRAFSGCENLADESGNIIINDMYFDFIGNNILSSAVVNIPAHVKQIKNFAFIDSGRISKVIIAGSETELEDLCFCSDIRVERSINPVMKQEDVSCEYMVCIPENSRAALSVFVKAHDNVKILPLENINNYGYECDCS